MKKPKKKVLATALWILLGSLVGGFIGIVVFVWTDFVWLKLTTSILVILVALYSIFKNFKNM